jgi:hypothetical protein
MITKLILQYQANHFHCTWNFNKPEFFTSWLILRTSKFNACVDHIYALLVLTTYKGSMLLRASLSVIHQKCLMHQTKVLIISLIHLPYIIIVQKRIGIIDQDSGLSTNHPWLYYSRRIILFEPPSHLIGWLCLGFNVGFFVLLFQMIDCKSLLQM